MHGGKNELSNLITLCELCRARHNSHYADYVVMPRSASTPTTMLLLYAA
jgi:5-methylcytosine-specific restriction endonuclease McrA